MTRFSFRRLSFVGFALCVSGLAFALLYGGLGIPIGWLAGSVVAQVRPQDRAALAEACGRIRHAGACEITFQLEA